MLTVAVAQALAARQSPAFTAPSYTEPDGTDWPAPPADWPTPTDAPLFDEPSQEPDPFEAAMIAFNPSTYMPANVPADLAQLNLRAALDTIAWCEGTDNADGYRTMFGYRYFDSFADHPRQKFTYTDLAGNTIITSAAGRYQIIIRTWDALRARLRLTDFSPASQDAAAVELIRERGALQDAYAGRMLEVARKCRAVWASLPGSTAAQPKRTPAAVAARFVAAGGTMA